LFSNQSILILADDGGGKTTFANNVAKDLRSRGAVVAIADYGGSAKKTFTEISDQLGIQTFKLNSVNKKIPLTADQLRDDIESVMLVEPRPILICDNAHRYPLTVRYWLEEICNKGAVVFLLATKPPRKDIFLKMTHISLQPLATQDVRSLMLAEAKSLGVSLDNNKLATLQERTGGNPFLAKRVVQEEVMGINDQAGDHVKYIDGTPFLIGAISLVAILRFIGLGLGDKSLYIIGGIAMVLAISLRIVLLRANSRSGNKMD
jgi:GTPase SAR1 family protein